VVERGRQREASEDTPLHEREQVLGSHRWPSLRPHFGASLGFSCQASGQKSLEDLKI
jgi:hypothetical protein